MPAGTLGTPAASPTTEAQPAQPAQASADCGTRPARVSPLRDNGGRLDWSRATNQIAFDQAGPNGYFDVYVMNPDGSGERCLTCAHGDVLGPKHKGNPAWHPSGRYIVFQVQRVVPRQQGDTVSAPGAGVFNDLWLMTADGEMFWKLYEPPFDGARGNLRDAPGTLHPVFSDDGNRLFWAERLRGATNPIGEWALKLADIALTPSGPRLGTIQTFQPGEQHSFYESHGFSPDGSKLLFSGNLQRNQPVTGLDIYTLELATQRLTNLTNSPREWDEHAHYSPDGSTIVWMSGKGQPPIQLRPYRQKTELWVMNADGTNPRQLTHFNTPGRPEYIAQNVVVPGDNAWGPDGTRLATLVLENDPNGPARDRGPMVLIAC